MGSHQFNASWWLRGGHGQTLWPVLTRRIRLQSRTERLELSDGDFVRLDWVGTEGPIVIVLPGLQGDLQSSYVRGVLQVCHKRGWRGVLLNFRGRGEPNRLPQSYHSGMTYDLNFLVHSLRQQEPTTPIAVVGFSVGANILLKWLGEAGRCGEALPVARKIERGLSRIYQWHLLKSLRRDIGMKMGKFNHSLTLTHMELQTLRTFAAFDSRITAPLNGFNGADDYYEKTRTDVLLRYISVPTLILNARNDPLVPVHLIPNEQDVSDQVMLEITDNGGHMGFVHGHWPWRPHFWLDTRVPEFLTPFL